ncbi:MAG TPA: anti-sigma factor [Acidimicrobiales bacterium]|nr:anti-sigma factor [Acidimicrobiales bacterium]
MATDDDLLDQLRTALRPEPRPIDDERVQALRAAVAERASSGLAVRPTPVRRLPRRTIGPIAALAAAVAAFVLGGTLLRGSDEPGREDLLAKGIIEFETTLQAPDGDATAEVTGVLTGIGRVVQLRTDDLAILPKGEFYEVWFVGPGDTPRSPNRISAGTFHPDEQGRSRVDLTAAVNPELYPELSVTAEPGDGDPLPGGPEVLRADIELFER